MRADRLLSIILAMQARAQVTAAELAEELEVSERTIRRDLDALLVAGVPIYSQRGRGGGWALLGGHRLNVSGLLPEEAQALSLQAGTQRLRDLGLDDAVRSALQKLLAVLPEPVREGAIGAHGAIHEDPSAWGGRQPPAREPPEHLPELRRAVVSGLQVDLGYRRPGAAGASVRRVQPLGLVLKGSAWYLVALTEEGQRTYRVSRVESLAVTGDPVVRPEGFDLGETWAEAADLFARRFATVAVRLAVQEGAEASLARDLGRSVTLVPVEGGFECRFPSTEVAVTVLARLGDHVEVVSPPEVRAMLRRLGQQLASRYAADEPRAAAPDLAAAAPAP